MSRVGQMRPSARRIPTASVRKPSVAAMPMMSRRWSFRGGDGESEAGFGSGSRSANDGGSEPPSIDPLAGAGGGTAGAGGRDIAGGTDGATEVVAGAWGAGRGGELGGALAGPAGGLDGTGRSLDRGANGPVDVAPGIGGGCGGSSVFLALAFS